RNMPGIPSRVLPGGQTAYAWSCCCFKQNADGSVSVIWDYASSGVYCDVTGWYYDTPQGMVCGDTDCRGSCNSGTCTEVEEGDPQTSNDFKCVCQ
ncbi:MAG: hypothetical protein ACKN9R_02335, partial [Candidatus Limnocylindrus sp.]